MTSHSIRIGNTTASLRRTQAADLASRQAATTILSPEAVSGKVSPAKALMTTIDGQARPITADDLHRFRASITKLGENLRAGITPREVLAMSRPIDLQRAKAEIRHAVPVLMRGSVLRLATDSGPASKVSRHIIEIEFPSFKAAVARPATPQQAATWLLSETPIRFDCDCERHRYWYRYIASIGQFAAGRIETGFPKIRNPNLEGVACKHVIRGLGSLESMLLRRHVAKAIEQARNALDKPGARKTVTVRASQADADRATSRKTARRIVVPAGAATRESLAPQASQQDIAKALRTYAARTDPTSQAIARALESLAQHVAGRT